MRALVIALIIGLATIVGCQQVQDDPVEENVVFEQDVDDAMINKRAGQSESIAVSLERTNSSTMLFTIRMLEDRRLDPTTIVSYEVDGTRVPIPFGEIVAEREGDVRTYVYQADLNPDLFVTETLPLFHIGEDGEAEVSIPLEVINSTNE
ncbi:hypothetical protein [Exiguobacterium sp. TNDT2]|uniref:hypothetical protein n=1 Tax=Exiguobacterium sp. TNDT2 TaxID=2233531 RepID=UPI000DEF5C83|nr:hypothetical protein [Exiguobacterium sp. TNDT2]